MIDATDLARELDAAEQILRDRRASLVADRDRISTSIAEIDRALAKARLAFSRLLAPPRPPKKPPICAVKTCPVCRLEYAPRSNRQILCASCRETAAHVSATTAASTPPDSSCRRCGKAFKRKAGSRGRYCSRTCYVDGAEPDDRRAALLAALYERQAARYASDLLALPEVLAAGNKRASINGDLQALQKLGRVVSSPDGWRLVSADYPAVAASESKPVRPAAPRRIVRPSQPEPVLQAVSSDPEPVAPESLPEEPSEAATARPKTRIHCAHCRDLFWSLGPHHRVCNVCLARPAEPAASTAAPLPLPNDDDLDFEVVWRPGRDAPSLTDPLGHLKSSLGGVEHLIHRP